jgi:hypothetical protein
MGHMGQNLCSVCRLQPVCGKATAIAPVEPNGCSSFKVRDLLTLSKADFEALIDKAMDKRKPE